MKKEYLTIREAAKELQVNPITLTRWVRNKRIEALRQGEDQGARYRIHIDSIEKFKRENSPFLKANA